MKLRYPLIVLILAFFIHSEQVYGQKLKGIGLNGGYTLKTGKVQKGFGIEVHADFNEVLKYLFFMPSIAYWQTDFTEGDYSLQRNHFNFGAKFIGYFNPKPRGVYAGIGLYYHFIGNETRIDYTEEISTNNEQKLGFSILAGYLLRFKRVSLFLEPRYSLIHGGYNTFQTYLGVTYYF